MGIQRFTRQIWIVLLWPLKKHALSVRLPTHSPRLIKSNFSPYFGVEDSSARDKVHSVYIPASVFPRSSSDLTLLRHTLFPFSLLP